MQDTALTRITIKPTGMRLHEWICFDQGFWAQEGLDPRIEEHHHTGRTGPWGDYGQRPQDKTFIEGEQAIGNACAWGTSNAAGLSWSRLARRSLPMPWRGSRRPRAPMRAACRTAIGLPNPANGSLPTRGRSRPPKPGSATRSRR